MDAAIANRPKPDQAATSGNNIRPCHGACRALRIGERIDNSAKQNRLNELRNGQRHVGKAKHPTQLGLLAEHSQNAEIKAQEFHADSANVDRVQSFSATLTKWAALARKGERRARRIPFYNCSKHEEFVLSNLHLEMDFTKLSPLPITLRDLLEL